MNPLTIFITFVLGTIIGSFLSVVIHRIKAKKKGIFLGRSMCPNCKKTLKWSNLIPILSWIFQGGKCSKCKKKISMSYPALELTTGIIFIATLLKWSFIIESNQLPYFIFYLAEFIFLITIFFFDLLYKEIPDKFSIPPIIIAIIGGLLLQIVSPISMALGILAVGGFFLIQYILSKGLWVGGGDIRLGALMGALLGLKMGVMALVLAYLIGGIFAAYLLIAKKVSRKTQIPFGPFLITGIFLTLFYGEQLLTMYQSLFLY